MMEGSNKDYSGGKQNREQKKIESMKLKVGSLKRSTKLTKFQLNCLSKKKRKLKLQKSEIKKGNITVDLTEIKDSKGIL